MKMHFGRQRVASTSENRTPKGVLLILGSIFLLVGVIAFGVLATSVTQNALKGSWDKVPLDKVSGEVRREVYSGGDTFGYEVDLEYQYTVAGRSYSQSENHSFDNHYKAQQLLDKALDTEATVFVDPDDPMESQFELESMFFAFFLLIPLLFIVLGAGFVWGVFRFSNKRKSLAHKSKQNSKMAPIIMRIIGIVMFGGAGIGAYCFYPTLLAGFSLKNWDRVECTVLASGIEEHSGDDGSTYSADIYYEYDYQGRTLRSSYYSLISGSSSNYSKARRLVETYASGTKHVAFVNPSDPLWAVLNSSAVGVYAITGVIGVVMLIGLVLLLLPLSSGEQRVEYSTQGLQPVRTTVDTENSFGDPKGKRKLSAIITFVVALFWNGIVSMFFLFGGAEGGAFLFLIPFAAIGVILIGVVGYMTLKVYSPVVYLEWDPPTPALGDSLEVRWKVEGDSAKFTDLEVVLQGVETAIYRRGTDTVRVHETFHVQNKSCMNGPHLSRQGALRFTLPQETMHSFNGEHNKITWSLTTKGAIPRWPDVSDEYPLQVLSLEVS